MAPIRIDTYHVPFLPSSGINGPMNHEPRKGWRRWFPLLVLGAVLALAVLLVATRPRPEPVEPRERAWLVSVEPVRLQTLSPHLTLYGRLESRSVAQLVAGVAAEVQAVPVSDGDRVSRGQLLVRLDERESRLRLAQREAEVREAQARLEAEVNRHEADRKALKRERRLLQLLQAEVNRLKELVRRQAGARSALDNARQAVERQAVAVTAREQAIADHPARQAQLEAALQRARAARDQAQLELERCRVTAPFDGRISEVKVAPGRRTRLGDPLLTLYDTGAMRLRALIPDRYLATVRQALAAGAPPEVRGELDGVPLRGRLQSLAGEVEVGSGGVAGLFQVEGDPAVLQQGRFLRLDLTLPPRPGVVALPPEAVYGADKIYVVDEDSRMRPLRVERLGEVRAADGGSRLLVRSPALRDGMRVITTQLPNAVEGLRVRVAEAPAQ